MSLLLVIICDFLDNRAPGEEDAGSEGGELHEVEEVVDRVSGLSHEGVGLVFRPRDFLGHTPGHQASQWSHGAGMYYRIDNGKLSCNLYQPGFKENRHVDELMEVSITRRQSSSFFLSLGLIVSVPFCGI